MAKRWKTYIGTLVGIWGYTVLVFVAHLCLTAGWATDILLVAVVWSVINYILTLYYHE